MAKIPRSQAKTINLGLFYGMGKNKLQAELGVSKEKSDELLLIIKTLPKFVEDCKELILKYHNYDVPEIILIDGDILNNSYKNWFIKNSQRI